MKTINDLRIHAKNAGSQQISISGNDLIIVLDSVPSSGGGGSSQWGDVSGGINYADGNVGINNDTPTVALDVVGNVKVTNNAVQNINIQEKHITLRALDDSVNDGNFSQVELYASDTQSVLNIRSIFNDGIHEADVILSADAGGSYASLFGDGHVFLFCDYQYNQIGIKPAIAYIGDIDSILNGTVLKVDVINSTITVIADFLKLIGLPIYANNAAAITGGLAVNGVYKTATGELRIVV